MSIAETALMILGVLRFLSLVTVLIYTVRMIKQMMANEGRGLIGKSLQHLCSYPQDISIMIFTPIYLYLALFKGDFQGNIFEEFILIPLAVYIGAPLVKEVFFHPRS